MPESLLAKKMKLNPGLKAAVIDAPEMYLNDLQHDAEVSSRIRRTWISFPKGTSKIQAGLTRDNGLESLQALDLKWITLVSVDET